MNYTDGQLKKALAKMLPDIVRVERAIPNGIHLYWVDGKFIKDAELLHACWLIEEVIYNPKYRPICWQDYLNHLASETSDLKSVSAMFHASWRERTVGLAKTKGIEII